MKEPTVMDIIRLCRGIDEAARSMYTTLRDLCRDKRLSKFWDDMSREEADHITFWRRAEQFEPLSDMPSLFEQPHEVIAELNHTLSRAQELLRSCEKDFNVATAFTLAYRMEFYLLHPAFEMLFHLLGPSAGGSNPEDQYDSHIDTFIDMMSKYGDVTPELELLGETLQRLWRENKRLALQSSHDELTGILNRRGFFTVCEQFAHLAHRTQTMVCIMMIDLDHFKDVNDRFGHTTGDFVLKETARLLKTSLRAADIIGRYGGEEFIVMIPDISVGAIEGLAEKLRLTVENNPPGDIPLTISIGIAHKVLGKPVREDLHQLIQHADTALYRAKDAGRNTAVRFRGTGEN